MRAPSYKGLRDDKPAVEVTGEGQPPAADDDEPAERTPDSLFDEVERLPDGALAVLTEGRRLKLTNWDKVLFPETGFTKGDLIFYYARVAPVVLPHLRDRPLTLKRYPTGVGEQYFYEKQSPSHRPEWVQTAKIGSVNYTLAQDRPTLIWLANLADIELHTSLAFAARPERPTMLVFDLDPGEPARERGQDFGVEGDAGLRAAQRPGHLQADQAVRASCGGAARTAPRQARRLTDDQAAARRTGAGRLEPERRAQDDRHRLLGART